MPVMYEAAGDARKATAAPNSDGSPKRCIGISALHSSDTASSETPRLSALERKRLRRRSVDMEPGSTLLTVIPKGASSPARVLDQLATAARMVLETPRLRSGVLTEVEMICMIRPYPSAFMPGTTAC